ncbi:hypothetical protein [Zavarzinia aquatilis]|uniref:Uncharacterized protein n=1 Tax=Zavarzinia aquatilis TaxID=2211142 RepID=A0A317E643_9PROT|nr:hypothetical protein [Zavarzinia aquatilis]PWR22578.1 hypothetical protein DKG74_11940 [Zavarzinia aquatilis]
MSTKSWMHTGVRVVTVAALMATAACADKRLGAPGQAPPLDTMSLSGTPKAVAECTMAAMQAADECDDIDSGLGITTNEVTKTVQLTCYNVTPAAVSAGAAFGILGVLIGAAVGEKEKVGESNKRPPYYTVQLKETSPKAVEAGFWVATSIDGPESRIAKLKSYLGKCDGQMAEAPPAPVLVPPQAAAAPAADPVKPAN